MNNLLDDVEDLEENRIIDNLLFKQREAEKKLLYIEMLPLDSSPLSCREYKTLAHTLQASIQKYKETLINTSINPYDICLDIISNIYGFDNWHLFENAFQWYSEKSSDTKQATLLCSQYKAKARSLQSALQREKNDLIKYDRISYNQCLHIVSNIYGFENWQVVKITLDEKSNKAYNENIIKYIEYKFNAFLYEFKENDLFFNDEYLGDKDYFISDLTKISKKISILHKILSNDRKILSKDMGFPIVLTKYCCFFYCSINQIKIEEFLDDLWSSRNLDELNEFDPISFALDDFDKIEIIFERIRAPYSFIYLIQSAKILLKNKQLGKNYQSSQQIYKTINLICYCLSILQMKDFQSIDKDCELKKIFHFDPALLNFLEIASKYNLLQ